jgi:TRAP transporter TAXI family solute receptor
MRTTRFSILLSVLLLALILGGCGNQSAGNGGSKGTGNGSATTDSSKEDSTNKITDVRVAAINNTSSHYVYINQLANAINSNSKLQKWTIIETGGIEENHALLERGEADIALTAPATLYQAKHGIGSFKKENKNLRTLWTWVLPPQTMVARKDSGVTTLSDLDGKSIMPGGSGTSTAKIFKTMFENLDINPKYVAGSLDDGVTNMKDGRIVAFGKASPGFVPDATYLQMESSVDLVPVGFSTDEVSKIKETMSYVDFLTVPANTVMSENPEFVTWVAPLMFAANADFSDKLAYDAIKIAIEAKDEIAESYAGTKSVDYIKDTIANSKTATVPLSPGVVDYFEDKGVQVPDELKAK